MLKHSRAGIPFEVMGLMVGEILDDYTITVVDVFSMPQTGTTISVESVDPVYQTEFMDMSLSSRLVKLETEMARLLE